MTGTDRTRATYDRISWAYDLMEAGVERVLFRRWRQEAFALAQGKVLEVGVGTGKNIPYYPAGTSVFAVDLSAKMMRHAQERARRAAVRPRLMLMDAQHLAFKAQSFDTVVATFVYCSVRDPVLGLGEICRVCEPSGRVLLLEHVRSAGRIKGRVHGRAQSACCEAHGAQHQPRHGAERGARRSAGHRGG